MNKKQYTKPASFLSRLVAAGRSQAQIQYWIRMHSALYRNIISVQDEVVIQDFVVLRRKFETESRDLAI